LAGKQEDSMPKFYPSTIDYGSVAKGGTAFGATTCGVLSAPVNVTARISDDTSGGALTLLSVTSWMIETVTETPDPSELPAGTPPPKPVKVQVPVQQGQSNGVTPLAVAPGQYVQVNIQFAPTASTSAPMTATLLISGDTWSAPVAIPIVARCWYSANNAILVNNCKNLQNLTVSLEVTEDLITLGDVGFSLQLNCFPQITPQINGYSLRWIQYVIDVNSNSVYWGIQYWSAQTVLPKTPGFGFNPSGNYGQNSQPPIASAKSNQMPKGSVMKIALATDSSGNVTSATFSITDPKGKVSKYKFSFPSNALAAIYGFEVNLVAAPSAAPITFTSGAGTLTYRVSSGTLAVQTNNKCTIAVTTNPTTPPSGYSDITGGYQSPTGEKSNAVYGNVTPASGPTVSQSLFSS
jgi:hypothetical protein